MDTTTYLNIYDGLSKRSKFTSDLFMSKDYEELLANSGACIRGSDNSGPLHRMQLAAEEFRADQGERDSGAGEDWRQQKFIRNFLNRKLKEYTASERRTIMIAMIGNATEILGGELDSRSQLKLLKEPIEEVERRLIELILHLSSAIMPEEGNFCDSEGDVSALEQREFSLGAGVCAAYACDEELRKYPEMIGIVSEAAAMTAESIGSVSETDAMTTESMDRMDYESLVEDIAVMMMMSAAVLIISILIGTVFGTGVSAAAIALEGSFPITVLSIGEIFISFVELFAIELKILFGMGISGAVAEALVVVKRWYDVKSHPLASVGADADVSIDCADEMEADEEDEYDDEYDDKYDYEYNEEDEDNNVYM